MSPDTAKCPICNHQIRADAEFCTYCGARNPGQESRSRSDAERVPHPDTEVDEFEVKLRGALGSEYELLESIGEGGFARVYKARDRRLDRLVAIKVIRPDLAGAKAFLDRFRREGVALAQLRHPGIVPIYDIRESADLIYYVMPFVEGETLKARLERLGRLPPVEAHRILSELAYAVAATHRAGIVHRDIKPENVILEGSLSKVLLTDFGIAKAVTQDGERLTGSGVLVGTPTYMSPEQAAGGSEIDNRADIYSLGVLAYHMVTGSIPFTGTPQEVIVKHITETPTPAHHVNPSLPRALSDIVTRCMAKEASDRFETAMDLWRELQTVRLLPSGTEREAKPVPARLPSITAGALAIGIIMGFALGRQIYHEAAAPEVPAVETAARPTAITFVAGWLEVVAALANEPDSDSLRQAAATAFSTGASITPAEAGLDLTSSPARLTPPQLLSDPAYLSLLANINTGQLTSREDGNVTILIGSYSDSESECGTALFTVQPSGVTWTVSHLLLLDSAGDCR